MSDILWFSSGTLDRVSLKVKVRFLFRLHYRSLLSCKESRADRFPPLCFEKDGFFFFFAHSAQGLNKEIEGIGRQGEAERGEKQKTTANITVNEET